MVTRSSVGARRGTSPGRQADSRACGARLTLGVEDGLAEPALVFPRDARLVHLPHPRRAAAAAAAVAEGFPARTRTRTRTRARARARHRHRRAWLAFYICASTRVRTFACGRTWLSTRLRTRGIAVF